MKRFLLLISIIIITATQIHAQGPVAWYMFNGNARDTSGSGLHGTINGATNTVDRFGQVGGALLFNGSS
ncbi:MAG TPA: hypothetical protein PKJ64_16080, partial [bacterium]|nr:hypothetical protein [bacterium]